MDLSKIYKSFMNKAAPIGRQAVAGAVESPAYMYGLGAKALGQNGDNQISDILKEYAQKIAGGQPEGIYQNVARVGGVPNPMQAIKIPALAGLAMGGIKMVGKDITKDAIKEAGKINFSKFKELSGAENLGDALKFSNQGEIKSLMPNNRVIREWYKPTKSTFVDASLSENKLTPKQAMKYGGYGENESNRYWSAVERGLVPEDKLKDYGLSNKYIDPVEWHHKGDSFDRVNFYHPDDIIFALKEKGL
jgi:hypothetical protein